ncbi:MAG: thiamine phosphate synthase [Candidatus Omnitrophica bacterium]|nr:thiamine phosphate synthase [Candidatus Omnitrophota bacterium]MBU4479456.1 thiamine phosphate synthase [Candidatus Omnitrophota bacterium]
MKGYYFITDSKLSLKGNLSDISAAVKAQVRIIQYRSKDRTVKQMYAEALALRKIARGALFIINDRIDIALAVDADGVHLGAEDMPYEAARKILGKDRIIGLTVHTVEQAEHAQLLGADYLGVSAIFATRTKPDAGNPSGVELIRRIKKIASIPVVAIGGITLENAPEVINAGADALCAISAVVTHPDVAAAIISFQKLFSNLKNLKDIVA